MYKIDNTTAVTSIPTPEPVGPHPGGFFFDGNESLGEVSTIVNADWLNAVQEEICAVITGAGIALSKTDRTQLLQAMQLFIQNPPYAHSTSTPNAYIASIPFPPVAYFDGMLVILKFTHGNTGAATVNLNALGVVPITYTDGNPLVGGEIPNNGIGIFLNDGANFQLLNPQELANTHPMHTKVTWVTSTQAYTPSAGMFEVEFDLLAGGASGGGGVGGGGTGSGGGGGGAGERRIGSYTSTQIAAAGSVTLTVGAGGAVQAPAFDGANGGNSSVVGSSVGNMLVANGGGAGLHSPTHAGAGAIGGGTGGSGGSGGIGFQGQSGTQGITLGSSVAIAGNGGSTAYGAGGVSTPSVGGTSSSGVLGSGFGSGGSGGASGTTDSSGGLGMNGVIKVTERCAN